MVSGFGLQDGQEEGIRVWLGRKLQAEHFAQGSCGSVSHTRQLPADLLCA